MNIKIKGLKILIFVLLLSLSQLILHIVESSALQDQDQVKSALIYNFIKFIDWPKNRMQSADDTFCMGIIGRDPMVNTLKMLENKIVKGRKIIFKQYHSSSEVSYCHVIYISPSLKEHFVEIHKQLKGKGILTISHYKGFDKDGGIIDFYIKDNKFKFIINNDNAISENLKISSKLLNLAIVSESGQPEGN